MSPFVYTPTGYVRADKIDLVKRKRNGNFELFADGKLIDDNNPTFDETVISYLPANGNWECLITCNEDDGTLSILSNPVVAWGQTILDGLIPVTPGEMEGVHGEYALREVGKATVYSANNLASYESEKEWLASIKPESNLKLVVS